MHGNSSGSHRRHPIDLLQEMFLGRLSIDESAHLTERLVRYVMIKVCALMHAVEISFGDLLEISQVKRNCK